MFIIKVKMEFKMDYNKQDKKYYEQIIGTINKEKKSSTPHAPNSIVDICIKQKPLKYKKLKKYKQTQ